MHGERRAVLIALVANAVIAVAKDVGGVVTGSSAMLAETAHSVADTVDQVLMLVSLRLGDRKPDEEHPFGYGKDRFLTFLVAVIIFLADAIFSIGDGVLRLTGHELLAAAAAGSGSRSSCSASPSHRREPRSCARSGRRARTRGRPATASSSSAVVIGLLLVYVAYAPGRDSRGLRTGSSSSRTSWTNGCAKPRRRPGLPRPDA